MIVWTLFPAFLAAAAGGNDAGRHRLIQHRLIVLRSHQAARQAGVRVPPAGLVAGPWFAPAGACRPWPGWTWRGTQADLQDVRDGDALLAVENGTQPKGRVTLELGAAIAQGKPGVLERNDFRRCSDSENDPLNLMVFRGLPQSEWRDWLCGWIEANSNPDKTLAR